MISSQPKWIQTMKKYKIGDKYFNIPNYLLPISKLAMGNNSCVIEAKDIRFIRKTVVIKKHDFSSILNKIHAIERLLREMQLLSIFKHKNIMHCYNILKTTMCNHNHNHIHCNDIYNNAKNGCYA